MCTVSWVFRDTPAGPEYDLFFNRDESRRRGRAEPPRVVDLASCSALMPIDTDAGGTWVVTNAHGLTVALLNLYRSSATAPTTQPLEPPRSRGLLVRDLGDAADLDAVAARLARLDPTIYRPFTVLAVEAKRGSTGPATARWDGQTFDRLRAAHPPLVSSGQDLDAAFETRRRQWQTLTQNTDGRPRIEDCLDFHRSHQPTRGALSPCMHRPDARTVSLVHVRVAPSSITMRYADGPPCRSALGSPLSLDRIAPVMATAAGTADAAA